MRAAITIFRWEFKKILSNWRKTLLVFVVPALLLLIALNLFPLIVNYLSTGSLQNRPIILLNPPESFVAFTEQSNTSTIYSYTTMSKSEYNRLSDDERKEMIKDGSIFLRFSSLTARDNIQDKLPDWSDATIEEQYEKLANHDTDVESTATIFIMYNANSYSVSARAEQFSETVLTKYSTYILETMGQDYLAIGGGNSFKINEFNPFTTVLNHRSTANQGAARVLPGILVLLMYYCVYSLTGEILAAERERGFLTKLRMTPISESSLLLGKLLTILVVGMFSSLITFLILFISSWVNRSNNALSLLPFGMLLMPSQLILVIVTLFISCLLMIAICFLFVVSLKRMQDVLINLQLPLVLFLIDFFAQLFRYSDPVLLEYLIPLHNTTIVIRDIFLSQETPFHIILSLSINAIVGWIVFARTTRKFKKMSHSNQGGQND